MIRHLLNRHVQKWREVTADDGMGGRSVSWTHLNPVADGEDPPLNARLSQPDAKGIVRGNQSSAELSDVVYWAPGEDVQRGDQLRVDDRVLYVIAVITPSVAAYVRADCSDTQPTTHL